MSDIPTEEVWRKYEATHITKCDFEADGGLKFLRGQLVRVQVSVTKNEYREKITQVKITNRQLVTVVAGHEIMQFLAPLNKSKSFSFSVTW